MFGKVRLVFGKVRLVFGKVRLVFAAGAVYLETGRRLILLFSSRGSLSHFN